MKFQTDIDRVLILKYFYQFWVIQILLFSIIQVLFCVLFSVFGFTTFIFGFVCTIIDPTDPLYYEEREAEKKK